MQTQHITTAVAGLACLLAMSGCSTLGGDRQTITIRSEPPQATVLADGTDLGTTPLTFKPADAFRTGVTTGGEGILAYRYIGKLTVKKPGCKDFVTEVDDSILSKDIDVTLECDPDYRPPASAAPAPQQPAAPAARPAAMPTTAEERLQRIESLHDKGLISDGEYRELRQRVLDTL
ncbi:MAG: PEGA domain-containing protein [Thiohalobacterales bacterium]|nr:PEGA domain-containing protein [Thiohalobacterales bacterium]